MFRTTALVACAWLVMAVAPVGADDDKKADVKKMEGTWTVTAAEKDGKKQAAADVKDKTVKITKDKITCLAGEKTEAAYTYTVDTTAKQWTITMKGTEGDHKDKTVKGIVTLDGDTLKICFSKPDDDAPTKFETKEGQCCFALTRSK
jgi:uncharacterized protein (TIGR03067 family)